MNIPFNKPYIAGKELYYIAQAVIEHRQISGDGVFTKLCEKWMAENLRASRVFLTHSCTASLEMAAILAEIGAGDEVILPSYTFVSTANAFALRGAKLQFCEIRSDTLNIDENLIEPLINEKTKAIVAVHYAGVSCEMDKIMELSRKYDLVVVEDAAQAVNATYKGKHLGTIGHFGCFSFHETKNFISGEGGALAVNDERHQEKAEIIREKGTNRAAFLNGEVDKYTWVDLGSSYLPSDMIAAFLYAQLELADEITRKRNDLYEYYVDGLRPLAERGVIQLPYHPDHCSHNAHMFYIIMENIEVRSELIRHLTSKGISALFHYIPLHSSPMGQKLGHQQNLPITDRISQCLLRLPCFYGMTREESDYVIASIHEFFHGPAREKRSD